MITSSIRNAITVTLHYLVNRINSKANLFNNGTKTMVMNNIYIITMIYEL